MIFKILIFAGAAVCIFGVKAYADHQQFMASSVRVMAVADETIPGGLWNRTPRPAMVSLRYEYGGAKYHLKVNAISKRYAALKEKDTIELVLIEGNPKKFMPAADLDRSGLLGPFLMITGTVLMAGAFFLLARK